MLSSCQFTVFRFSSELISTDLHQNHIRSDPDNAIPANHILTVISYTVKPFCRTLRIIASIWPLHSSKIRSQTQPRHFPSFIFTTSFLEKSEKRMKKAFFFILFHQSLSGEKHLRFLYIKPEQNHISILHHILFAFHSHKTFSLAAAREPHSSRSL